MHRTFDNAQGAHRTIGAVLDRGLQRRGDRRWGDVDRLLEKRSIERVWLVEDGQDMQAPMHDEAFERDLVAGNELLDQVSGGRLAHDGLEPGMSRNEALGVVGANDAARRRQVEWLQNAWIGDRRCDRGWIGIQRLQHEARNRHASFGQQLALLMLVARGACRMGGVAL